MALRTQTKDGVAERGVEAPVRPGKSGGTSGPSAATRTYKADSLLGSHPVLQTPGAQSRHLPRAEHTSATGLTGSAQAREPSQSPRASQRPQGVRNER